MLNVKVDNEEEVQVVTSPSKAQAKSPKFETPFQTPLSRTP